MKQDTDKILIRPIITEKCTDVREKNNVYAFEVHRDANKHQIKFAMEKIYGVKVEKVNILGVKGKRKRRRMVEGKRRDWKKAYITLKKGEKLTIFEGV